MLFKNWREFYEFQNNIEENLLMNITKQIRIDLLLVNKKISACTCNYKHIFVKINDIKFLKGTKRLILVFIFNYYFSRQFMLMKLSLLINSSTFQTKFILLIGRHCRYHIYLYVYKNFEAHIHIQMCNSPSYTSRK